MKRLQALICQDWVRSLVPHDFFHEVLRVLSQNMRINNSNEKTQDSRLYGLPRLHWTSQEIH